MFLNQVAQKLGAARGVDVNGPLQDDRLRGGGRGHVDTNRIM